MKKRQIVFQFLMEGVLIAVMAFVLTKPVTDAVGRLMSASVNQTLGDEPYDVSFDSGSGDMIISKTPTEPVALGYHITWDILLFVFGAMLLVVLAAVLSSSRSIMEQKPLEVLRSG